jgi:hypothetical protein
MAMTVRFKLTPVLFLVLFPLITSASPPYYGALFSYVAIPKEPTYLHGYQLMLNYDPQKFKWRKFNIYFDGGFSHFWVTNTPYYTTVNAYSIAPVIRYTFNKHGPVLPFLELSIGLAYLNHTRLDDRNLGMHFSFQDRAGIGALLGNEKLSIGIQAEHYSNAHLAGHNSGITAPLVLNIGYRFA